MTITYINPYTPEATEECIDNVECIVFGISGTAYIKTVDGTEHKIPVVLLQEVEA